MECVFDDLPEAKLLGHRYLGRQETCRLEVPVDQHLQPRAKSAGDVPVDVEIGGQALLTLSL
jgi:hypothetical protein